MSGARWALSIAAFAALCGCAPAREPGVYDLELHEAYSRLAENRLEDFRFKRQCGILIHFVPETILDKSVTWRVYSSGRELLSFTANLAAEGERKTRVGIHISKDADGDELYSGKRTYQRPALRQPLRPAVEEAIGAVLEGRPFDVSRVPRPTNDTICSLQRSRLEMGHRLSIDDEPGT